MKTIQNLLILSFLMAATVQLYAQKASKNNSNDGEEFIYIETKVIGGKVDIAWAVASEQSNNHYIVERSTDGTNFTAIGKVDGANDSHKILDYQFSDSEPAAGINYYRVKQTDFDGAADYSETLAAQFIAQNDKLLAISPNLSAGIYSVDVSAYNKQQVLVEITDFAGQTVETKKYDFSKPSDPFIEIDLSEHPKGLYHVILKTTTQMRKGKVIVI